MVHYKKSSLHKISIYTSLQWQPQTKSTSNIKGWNLNMMELINKILQWLLSMSPAPSSRMRIIKSTSPSLSSSPNHHLLNCHQVNWTKKFLADNVKFITFYGAVCHVEWASVWQSHRFISLFVPHMEFNSQEKDECEIMNVLMLLSLSCVSFWGLWGTH